MMKRVSVANITVQRGQAANKTLSLRYYSVAYKVRSFHVTQSHREELESDHSREREC